MNTEYFSFRIKKERKKKMCLAIPKSKIDQQMCRDRVREGAEREIMRDYSYIVTILFKRLT